MQVVYFNHPWRYLLPWPARYHCCFDKQTIDIFMKVIKPILYNIFGSVERMRYPTKRIVVITGALVECVNRAEVVQSFPFWTLFRWNFTNLNSNVSPKLLNFRSRSFVIECYLSLMERNIWCRINDTQLNDLYVIPFSYTSPLRSPHSAVACDNNLEGHQANVIDADSCIVSLLKLSFQNVTDLKPA